MVDVLDCGTLVWQSPTIVGTPFTPREDTAMAYDSKTCRLVFFGGWSNRWPGDTWVLNVSTIIGPPYACMGVSPDIGPVAGDTTLNISGIRLFLNAVEGAMVIVSGGISTPEDVVQLRELEPQGLSGVIIGKALYDHRITLSDAMHVADS